MRWLRVAALLLLTLGGRARAQDPSDRWTVSAMLGPQFRTERGVLLEGATLDFEFVLPSHGRTRWGIDLGGTQLLARAMVDGARVSAVESSLEAGVMAMTDVWNNGVWRLEAAAGVVGSVSVGCGHFVRDPVDTLAGAQECVNDFAHRGTTRVGPRVRLLAERLSARASFFAAAIASANTVAAGAHVAPGLLAGMRLPWR